MILLLLLLVLLVIVIYIYIYIYTHTDMFICVPVSAKRLRDLPELGSRISGIRQRLDPIREGGHPMKPGESPRTFASRYSVS